MAKSIVLMGGNLGDVIQTFGSTLQQLERFGEVLKVSSLYCSKAWGMEKGTPDFYNQALVMETQLSPQILLESLLSIENLYGRKRDDSPGYISRKLDLDIIFYADRVIETDKLIIPHPRMHQRNFTLVPLVEIIPEFVHPILGKTISRLLHESGDKAVVTLC